MAEKGDVLRWWWCTLWLCCAVLCFALLVVVDKANQRWSQARAGLYRVEKPQSRTSKGPARERMYCNY
ncbi:Uncharacterized protein HZ326_1986 [Fusarium oxysporum f. sp. albedinis]|nr:Uncharacterized protein HZ326_1986 [Fusarium oxysporum f. sp. albedinis]